MVLVTVEESSKEMADFPNTRRVYKRNRNLGLNERFTTYRSTVSDIRQTVREQRQESWKNRRFAQQTANRRSAIAPTEPKSRIQKHRFGQNTGSFSRNNNVKSRVWFGRRRNTNVRGRQGWRGRNNRTNRERHVVSHQRNLRSSRFRNSFGGTRSGISPMLKKRLGNRKLSNNKMRQIENRGEYKRGRKFVSNYRKQRGGKGNFRKQFWNSSSHAGSEGSSRGGKRPGRGNVEWHRQDSKMRQIKNRGEFKREEHFARNYRKQRGEGNFRKQFWNSSRYAGSDSNSSGRKKPGQRNGEWRRQERGRGRCWRQHIASNKNSLTKQELDEEMDKHMANSKGGLDADLDVYMSQADS